MFLSLGFRKLDELQRVVVVLPFVVGDASAPAALTPAHRGESVPTSRTSVNFRLDALVAGRDPSRP
jgi:hypothetical protein